MSQPPNLHTPRRQTASSTQSPGSYNLTIPGRKIIPVCNPPPFPTYLSQPCRPCVTATCLPRLAAWRPRGVCRASGWCRERCRSPLFYRLESPGWSLYCWGECRPSMTWCRFVALLYECRIPGYRTSAGFFFLFFARYGGDIHERVIHEAAFMGYEGGIEIQVHVWGFSFGKNWHKKCVCTHKFGLESCFLTYTHTHMSQLARIAIVPNVALNTFGFSIAVYPDACGRKYWCTYYCTYCKIRFT